MKEMTFADARVEILDLDPSISGHMEGGRPTEKMSCAIMFLLNEVERLKEIIEKQNVEGGKKV